MAKRGNVYNHKKRQKELKRKKKQEEKRLKRLNTDTTPAQDNEAADSTNTDPESGDTPEKTEQTAD